MLIEKHLLSMYSHGWVILPGDLWFAYMLINFLFSSVKFILSGAAITDAGVFIVVRRVCAMQQEDLVSLGKTVLALACNSIIGIQREHLQTSLDVVSRNYSADLKNLL